MHLTGHHALVPRVTCEIVRWTDDSMPGWVEARLIDADGTSTGIALSERPSGKQQGPEGSPLARKDRVFRYGVIATSRKLLSNCWKSLV